MSLNKYFFLKLLFFINASLIFTQDFKEEIIVTGSLNTNLEVTNSVFEFSDSDLKKSGVFRIEDFLNELPIIDPSNSSLQSNNSIGISSISIRGLGSDRSLILVDGTRIAPGTSFNGKNEQDLNDIPLELVKKIEVLTGGKTTIYGSDAIGGVVNFILDDNFIGTKLSMHQGGYQHRNNNSAIRTLISSQGLINPEENKFDGGNSSYSFTSGNKTKFSNIIFHASYKRNSDIKWRDRDIGSCRWKNGNSVCSLSSSTYATRFLPLSVHGSGGYISDSGFNSSSEKYNFGPDNFLQRPEKKIDIALLFKYKINEEHNLKINFFNTSKTSLAQIGAPLISGKILEIPCANPYFVQSSSLTCGSSDNSVTATIFRRFTEANVYRTQEFKNKSFKTNIKFDGNLTKDTFYSLVIQNNHKSLDYKYLNDLSLSKIKNALNINSSGECLVGGNCKPLNIFTNSKILQNNISEGITRDAFEYIRKDLSLIGEQSDNLINLSLFKNFSYKNNSIKNIKVASGFERRELKSIKVPISNFSDGVGQQYFHSQHHITNQVNQIFVQAEFEFVNNFDLITSFRNSNYSFVNDDLTYDIGFKFPFNDSFSIKGSHQKSSRAPNFHELFVDEKRLRLLIRRDPCNGSNPTYTLAQCQLLGLDSSLYGSVSNEAQLFIKDKGNIDLKSEEAFSNSLSLEYRDKQFNSEITFYEIKMSNQISQIEFDSILTRCVDSLDASSEWCGYINRALDGTFSSSGGFISSPFYNISSFKTEGIDFKINFSIDSRFGEIEINNFINILLKKNYQESLKEEERNCKGFYLLGNSDGLCYQPSPKFQNILNISIKRPTFGYDSEYNLNYRYIDSVKGYLYQNTSNNVSLKEMEYFDLNLNLSLEDDLDIYLGINNLLDSDPPINGDIGYVPGNANTFPSFYDPLGRYLFLKISKKIN